jgi:hypothetical protein
MVSVRLKAGLQRRNFTGIVQDFDKNPLNFTGRTQEGKISRIPKIPLGGVWFEELKFNKHCSTFVLFDKKIPILN